jgi:hypothetical protein
MDPTTAEMEREHEKVVDIVIHVLNIAGHQGQVHSPDPDWKVRDRRLVCVLCPSDLIPAGISRPIPRITVDFLSSFRADCQGGRASSMCANGA